MRAQKIRFIEPGNLPYRPSIRNHYTYDLYIRTPSVGLLTLATITRGVVPDTRMYSESISLVDWEDVYSADIVFIGIFTFAAPRGYEIARQIMERSDAVVVLGGLHASLACDEAALHCHYVLLGDGDEAVVDFIEAARADRIPEVTGMVYQREGELVRTAPRPQPLDIDTVPDRDLLVGYRERAGHNTLWLQVHASRGCPHHCDYCAVVQHFGHKVRKRSPASIVEDIRQCIAFHDEGRRIPRLSSVLWLTDDNFFADRKWAISVLQAIIDSGIQYRFTVQARYEVGFDDEMLDLLQRAGFFEIAMGIEFLEDSSFEEFHKRCTTDDLVRSIRNIQAHGIGVRGLFIVGADGHEHGVGKKIADFVIQHDITGILVQSMYFVPGTRAWDDHHERLIHTDWDKYLGHVVHYPSHISPADLQLEIIDASRRVYSPARLVQKLLRPHGASRRLFVGEVFWQRSVRRKLANELPYLRQKGEESGLYASA